MVVGIVVGRLVGKAVAVGKTGVADGRAVRVGRGVLVGAADGATTAIRVGFAGAACKIPFPTKAAPSATTMTSPITNTSHIHPREALRFCAGGCFGSGLACAGGFVSAGLGGATGWGFVSTGFGGATGFGFVSTGFGAATGCGFVSTGFGAATGCGFVSSGLRPDHRFWGSFGGGQRSRIWRWNRCGNRARGFIFWRPGNGSFSRLSRLAQGRQSFFFRL